MCDLHRTCGATRAYPNPPIDFAIFEYFVRSMPGIDVGSVPDPLDGSRTLALRDDETGVVELIAVPLDSGNVGFQIKPSPSRRLQRLICSRFRVELVCDDRAHHLDFIEAETTNWRPHANAS